MKIGAIKTIVKEELSRFGELPTWINPFLQTLNQFISQAGSALKGGLTFEDNFLCKVKQIKVKTGIEQEINPDSGKLRVTGVLVVNTGGMLLDSFAWAQKQNGNIGLKLNLSGASEATCTIIILLG